jgi:hypothetical protein
MGVETKIRELMEGAANRPLDKSQGDATNPTQGDSNPNPEMQDLSGTGNKEGGLTSEVGKAASSKASKDNTLPAGQGAGKAPNFDDKEDPRNVVAQASSKGNVHQEEVEETEEEEVILEDENAEVEAEAEEDQVEELVEDEAEAEAEEELTEEEETEDEVLFESDLEALFADEEHLTEEFKVKAANIFEAIVTSRVTSEVEAIEADLVEQANAAFEETKEELVENIDKYLSYVTENWMKENELAIESGLRSEITESFIKGMQQVFTEHYIEVPEEKYDVLAEMQAQIDSLKEKLDEQAAQNVDLYSEAEQLKKEKVFAQVCEDLASTETEKFATLVEDISFGSEEMYRQKLIVVKENYFPKAVASDDDKLEDSVEGSALNENSLMSRYATAISRASKF